MPKLDHPSIVSRLYFQEQLKGCFNNYLVTNDKGERWVLKGNPGSDCDYGLINEVLGWEFCCMLGLPFPAYKLLEVKHPYLDLPQDRLGKANQAKQLTPGLYFMSRYIPDLTTRRCYDLLPSVWLNDVRNRDECLGMFIFDVWADHRDRRQAIFAGNDAGFESTFIDNTHLFGGANRDEGFRPNRLSAVEAIAISMSRDSDRVRRWIDFIRQTLPKALERLLGWLPPAWRWAQTQDVSFEERCHYRMGNLDRLVRLALEQASSYAPAFRCDCVCLLPEAELPTTLQLI